MVSGAFHEINQYPGKERGEASILTHSEGVRRTNGRNSDDELDWTWALSLHDITSFTPSPAFRLPMGSGKLEEQVDL